MFGSIETIADAMTGRARAPCLAASASLSPKPCGTFAAPFAGAVLCLAPKRSSTATSF